MTTLSPVFNAPRRPEIAEGAGKWEYLVVPLPEATALKKADEPWAPEQLNELGRQGGKQSACRSSTATSSPGRSCCSSGFWIEGDASRGAPRGSRSPPIHRAPARPQSAYRAHQ